MIMLESYYLTLLDSSSSGRHIQIQLLLSEKSSTGWLLVWLRTECLYQAISEDKDVSGNGGRDFLVSGSPSAKKSFFSWLRNFALSIANVMVSVMSLCLYSCRHAMTEMSAVIVSFLFQECFALHSGEKFYCCWGEMQSLPYPSFSLASIREESEVQTNFSPSLKKLERSVNCFEMGVVASVLAWKIDSRKENYV